MALCFNLAMMADFRESGLHSVNMILKWRLTSWCLESEPGLGSVSVV